MAKTPAQNKIDSRLYVALLHQRKDARLAPLTSFRFVQPGPDGRVAVDIILTSSAGLKPAIQMLGSLGDTIQTENRSFGRISARVHLADLDALSAMPEIRKVRGAIPRKAQVTPSAPGRSMVSPAPARRSASFPTA
jgi:hypothetical protein